MAANQTHAIMKIITPVPTLPHISEKDIRSDATKPRRRGREPNTDPAPYFCAGRRRPGPLAATPSPMALAAPGSLKRWAQLVNCESLARVRRNRGTLVLRAN